METSFCCKQKENRIAMENKLQFLSITDLAFLLFLLCSSFAGTTLGLSNDVTPFDRTSFPHGFTFGASSSAYQYEGAAFEDGKGNSTWDAFTHEFPERILDRTNGDVALDFYHRYKEDVQLIKFIGLDAFRMSISWPRILPSGKLSGGVNKQGIAFYKNVFDELLANGITPFVTLFHWDLPQALEDEYKGFLSPLVVDDFRDFAEVCFKEFGGQVKNWITLNEPYAFVNGGYDGATGNLPPVRCSNRTTCTQGNSATEPYVAAHNQLLCHGAAVKLYKEKFQVTQKGKIGVTLIAPWFVPFSNSTLDVKAADRALEFFVGWFANPIVFGEYPKIMQSLVGKRLPKFTVEQSQMLKGSYDFLGLNYYSGSYVIHASPSPNLSQATDNRASLSSSNVNGESIGEATGLAGFLSFPQGLRDLLAYTKKKYMDPAIYITENGYGDFDNGTIKNGTDDPKRVTFYDVHLRAVKDAVDKDGVKVKGFFGWSLLDNFEWTAGFTSRFGICYVDYTMGLKRTPKKSAFWFKNFLAKK